MFFFTPLREDHTTRKPIDHDVLPDIPRKKRNTQFALTLLQLYVLCGRIIYLRSLSNMVEGKFKMSP